MFDSLFDFLKSDSFRDTGPGQSQFPAYIYVYSSDREFEFRDNLQTLQDRLSRPPAEEEPLEVNIFHRLTEHLDDQYLGDESMLEILLDQEPDDPEKVADSLRDHARSDGFIDSLAESFQTHVSEEVDHDRSYIFIHGWGAIYPHLRSSEFLELMESNIGNYKLILFYPGTYENGTYQLFGRLHSNNVYRAQSLNQMIDG